MMAAMVFVHSGKLEWVFEPLGRPAASHAFTNAHKALRIGERFSSKYETSRGRLNFRASARSSRLNKCTTSERRRMSGETVQELPVANTTVLFSPVKLLLEPKIRSFQTVVVRNASRLLLPK